MSNDIFARICTVTTICFLLYGCLPFTQIAKAPTLPYDGPYVIVEPKIGYPGLILDESGFKFPPGEAVTIDFIDPNGQIAIFHASHPKAYVTDMEGKFIYYYTVRQEELAGWWTYYASYGTGENLKKTPSVTFWVTNPTIYATSNKNNTSASLSGTGFTPDGKAQIKVDYIYADWAPSGGEVIKNTIYCEVDVDKTGKFDNQCKAERGIPLLGEQMIGSVRFSATDLTTGYPSNMGSKIELVHQFSLNVLGQEVSTEVPIVSSPMPTQALITKIYPIAQCCGIEGTQQSAPIDFQIQTETSGVFKIQYMINPKHCSDIRLHIFLNEKEVFLTDFMGPLSGITTSNNIDLGPVSAGNYTLKISPEGKVGGCNTGELRAWEGTLSVTISNLP